MVYTQPPPLIKDEIDSFIKKGRIARFCSINKDGTIHAVPVWYMYKIRKIIIGTPTASRKARNIKRNENVTILIDVEGSLAEGTPTRDVIIYGKAELDNKDMDSTAHSIFERYMPKEESEAYWRGLSELTEWTKTIVTPVHIASFDYAKDTRYETAVKKYAK